MLPQSYLGQIIVPKSFCVKAYDVFTKFDKDKIGTLQIEEFKKFLSLGISDEAEQESIFKVLDFNDSNEIDFRTFLIGSWPK